MWGGSNLIVGIIGGGVGAQIIGALFSGGEADTIVGSGGFDFGGSVLVVITGLIKENMGGQKPA
jgi:hypothetical protein